MIILKSISLHFDYFPLLVIMGLAWIIPLGLSALRIRKVPIVIAEIFLGYLAGKFLLSSISPESMRILEFLGLTGFIFMMFLGGLEIEIEKLYKIR
jgi:Kef-type K+ transport system membrane component KefB